MGSHRLQRVIRPIVFGVTARQVFFDIEIAFAPETGQVLGHLYRPVSRG